MKKYYLGLVALAVLTLGLGIFTVQQGLASKQDKETEEKVEEIAKTMDSYVRKENTIPKSLEEAGVKDVPSTIRYIKTSDEKYEVCVTYKSASQGYGMTGVSDVVWGAMYGSSMDDYEYDSLDDYESGYLNFYGGHKAGENCQTVKPYMYNSSRLNYNSNGPDSTSGLSARYSQSLSQSAAKARDTERVTDINTMYSKLEEFYNDNEYYPHTFTASTFPGIDSAVLDDPDGSTIMMQAPVADESVALDTNGQSSAENYLYIPYPTGCNNDCTGYVLRTYIELPSSATPNPYVKRGLSNN